MHSTWSDGSGAVPEIAAAAEERGTNMPRSPIIRLRIAKAAGVHTSLGTDEDGPAKLRFMESSTAAALLAGIEPARIFNHFSNEDLLGWVDSLRRKSSKSGVSGADSKSTRPRKRKLPSIRTKCLLVSTSQPSVRSVCRDIGWTILGCASRQKNRCSIHEFPDSSSCGLASP
jgi:hypothetical protein